MRLIIVESANEFNEAKVQHPEAVRISPWASDDGVKLLKQAIDEVKIVNKDIIVMYSVARQLWPIECQFFANDRIARLLRDYKGVRKNALVSFVEESAPGTSMQKGGAKRTGIGKPSVSYSTLSQSLLRFS